MNIYLRIFLIINSVCLLFPGCNQKKNNTGLPYYNNPDFTPEWLAKNETGSVVIHQIASFKCTDQDNNLFTEKMLNGKITVANFFFAECGSICPKMTRNLLKIQDSLLLFKDVQIISFTVTPWKDSIPVLKNYERENGIKNGFWYLLRGNKSEVYTLARKSFFAEEERGYNADSSDFLHTEHIILVDKNRHIRGVYNGTSALDMQLILHDIRVLKTED